MAAATAIEVSGSSVQYHVLNLQVLHFLSKFRSIKTAKMYEQVDLCFKILVARV